MTIQWCDDEPKIFPTSPILVQIPPFCLRFDLVFEITREIEEMESSIFFYSVANLPGNPLGRQATQNHSNLHHFVSNSAILSSFDMVFEITREMEEIDSSIFF